MTSPAGGADPGWGAVRRGPARDAEGSGASGAGDWHSELEDVQDLDAVASLPGKGRRSTANGRGTIAAVPDPVEPPAPVAEEDPESEDGEEPLNRGLLLKFLSSVRN